MVSDANAVRNLLTHGFAADLTDAGRARGQRRRRHGDGDRRPRLRAPARGASRRGRCDRDDSTRACGASSRRRSGWACSTTRTSTRTAPARCSADPAHRDGGPGRRRAVRGAAAQRGRPAAAGRRRAGLDRRASARWPTPARDTIGPWVFDFDLDETVTVLDGHPGPGRRRGPGRLRPGRPVGAARVPVDVRHVRRQHARRTPRASTTTPSSQRAVDLARGADVAVVVVGRVAEHDRRDGLAVLARAARTSARAAAGRRRRPARRSCCWS